MNQSTGDDAPGNTGEWFLEAVGKAIEEPPAPTVLDPGPPAAEEVDAPAEAATDAGAEPAAETTSEHVGAMWRAGGTQDPLEDWEPADLDRYVTRKRNFRWTIWIAVVLLLAVAGVAVLLAPRLVERQAAAEADEYAEALVALRGNLPTTQEVLRALTEPDTTTEELADLAPDLSRLETAADAVIDASTKELPTPLPLLPRDALDDLEPSRDAMARLGSDAGFLADRLKDGINYRSLVDGFLDPGELPTTATGPEVGDIQERLATTLADATAVLARLPGDAAFAAHRDALTDAIGTYRDWETVYVSALRAGDEETAAQLVQDHLALRADLANQLVPALATLRTELDVVILDLDGELADTINGLPR